MHERVAVHLAGGGQEEAGTVTLGDVEQVLRAGAVDRERVERPAQVLGRRRRAGEMHDVGDTVGDRRVEPAADDVELDELEAVVAGELCDVLAATGRQIVDADHVVATLDEAIAQMRAEEAGAAGDEDASVAHDRPTPS